MRRPRKAVNQMNVVPYIDVMLVLLIIFMVTAPLIAPGEIELPKVDKAPTQPKDIPPLEVTVRSDGSLWLRNRANPRLPMRHYQKDELIAQIVAAQKNAPDQAVVIAGDKNTPYENVVSVLDLLHRNRVNKVGLLVLPNQAGTTNTP
jgi:biopolymer transport protein TolR